MEFTENAAVNYSFVNILKQTVFWTVHLGCFAAIWTGVSWTAAIICFALYFIRMFAITGAYHRYFSHRTYQTSRIFQFILGLLGTSSAQKGPIWWASHHRHHHQYSDTEHDIHSPRIDGLWWSHVGWVLSTQFIATRKELVKDLLKFPELRLLDKYHLIAPILLATSLYFLGVYLNIHYPQLNTNGTQLLVWGFCISTTMLYHGTFFINSLTHLVGSRRFKTTDDSRNSLILALVTMGEGWHNNHHRYPGSEKQGMYWWEIDISHYVLKVLSWFGIVWNLRTYPERIYKEALENKAT